MIQPLRCSSWRRTPRRILLHRQQMKSLLTRRKTLVSRSSLGRAASSVNTEKESSIRSLARLSSSSDGGPNGGFYHDQCRDDPVTDFKLWRMIYRTKSRDFPAQHPCEKYRATEKRVFEAMARLDPVYMGRKSKNDIVFQAGDLRRGVAREVIRCRP